MTLAARSVAGFAMQGDPARHSIARSFTQAHALPAQYQRVKAVKSCIKNTESLRNDPAEVWRETIKSLPLKLVAHEGDVSPETVVSWRLGRNLPSYPKSVLLAQRIPKVQKALVEVITGGKANPHHHRLVTCLLRHLVEFTASADEVTAARARIALLEFADQSAMPIDGGEFL